MPKFSILNTDTTLVPLLLLGHTLRLQSTSDSTPGLPHGRLLTLCYFAQAPVCVANGISAAFLVSSRGQDRGKQHEGLRTVMLTVNFSPLC